MSTNRKTLSLTRPVSWHSSPQVSYYHLQHQIGMAYTSPQHVYSNQPLQEPATEYDDFYASGTIHPFSHMPLLPQPVPAELSDCTGGESNWQSYGHGGHEQAYQWVDAAQPRPVWNATEQISQSQYYDPPSEQDTYQLPVLSPDVHHASALSQAPTYPQDPLDKVLVGLGLYDRDTSSTSSTMLPSASLFRSAFDPPSPGKGLKLEESWQPSSPPDENAASEPATSPVPELDSSPVDEEQPFEVESEEYEDEHDVTYIANDFVFGNNAYNQQNPPYYPYQLGNVALPSRMSADPYGYNYAVPEDSYDYKTTAGRFSHVNGTDYAATPVWQTGNTNY